MIYTYVATFPLSHNLGNEWLHIGNTISILCIFNIFLYYMQKYAQNTQKYAVPNKYAQICR